MATHDYILDNASGAAFRTDLNNALAAIVSNNSNSSSPSTTYAYQWWADTSNAVLKIRNSANNAWIELFQLDGTLTLEDGSASTPALAFRDDLNTGIYSSAADTFNVATGGVERMELGTTTIFNEDGADVDFRIEGDTDTDLFYVDAGNDRVAIGNSTPATKLDVSRLSSAWAGAAPIAGTTIFAHSGTTSASSPSYLSISAGNTSISGINLGDSDDADVGQITYDHSDNSLDFRVNASSRLEIESDGDVKVISGNVIIGTSGKGIDFSATSDASGKTSELLDDYEEGTWTPTFQNVSAPTYTSRTGRYTKIGRVVYLTGTIIVASGIDTGDASAIAIGSLPFTADDTHSSAHFTFGNLVDLLPQSHLAEFDNVNMTSTLIALLKGDANLAYNGCNTSGTLEFAITYAT
tara:strand:+ start:7171 stop:8397 length:1227 start_codon:yes stop_codon:yes gene_type:complete